MNQGHTSIQRIRRAFCRLLTTFASLCLCACDADIDGFNSTGRTPTASDANPAPVASEVHHLRRIVERARLTREPHLTWNAFINLIATERYRDLSPTQRQAHLVFWYDSEVQNGGHWQYLENRGAASIGATLAALEALGLPCQASVLSKLEVDLNTSAPGTPWDDAIKEDLETQLDNAYFDCKPEVTDALAAHLEQNLDEYITLK